MTGLGLIYVIAVLTLFAKLLVFPGTRGSLGSTPLVASTAGIASDIASIHDGFSSNDDFTVGAGYVEFAPPPVEPSSTFEFSHASTTKQAQEAGRPEIAQDETSLPTAQRCNFTGG